MQTLLDKNYFDIFGLDHGFALDQAGLRERFRDLQRRYHPDNYASASEVDKRVSAQYAAHINQAFTTLKDPVLRARYILSLHGVDPGEDTHMDADFLMAQMELREQLEAARAGGAVDALMKLADQVDREYDARTEGLAGPLDEPDRAALEEAGRLVRELQFFDRLRQEIEDAEEAHL